MAHPPTHAQKHSACLLWPRPNASLDPFALKMCSHHTAPPFLREPAHLLDERVSTSRPASKCIISSAAPVLSSVLMHTPAGTLRTRALAMPKACREPFAVIYGARNGTSHSARNSCLSDQSLAHQNASCQAVYDGPGVAAQVNSSLMRALGILNACWDPSAIKRCLQHGTVDSACSSRAHHRPLVALNAP